MSFDFTDNQVPTGNFANGASMMLVVKDRLKVNGWTVVASGDGNGLSAVGSDVLTQEDTGANGFDNTRAWICLQQPGGGSGNFAGSRQIVFQRGDTGANDGTAWRFVYSQAGTANTSAINENQAPSFTDGGNVIGGGTAAAPTFDQLVANVGANAANFHIGIGDADENFGWWFWMYSDSASPSGAVTFVYMDPLVNVTPGDTDPFVLGSAVDGATGIINGRLQEGIKSEASAIYDPAGTPALQTTSFHGFPTLDMTNAVTAKDDLPQIYYGRRINLPGGYKGVSTLFRWRTTAHVDKDRYTVSTAGDRILVDDIVMKWSGAVPG